MSTPAPTAPAAPPRAATVLVLRAAAPAAVSEVAAGDVEVLLVRRSHRASFMANAYVFPGGRVDAADAVADPADPSAAADPVYSARRAAARELFEEVGLRVSDLGQLVRFAHWITPSAEPKRFDTEFFLWPLPSPAGSSAGTGPGPDASPAGPPPPELTIQVDGREVFDPLWITPAAALDRYAQGALNLPPPTVCTLEDLAAEIAAARSTPVAAAAPGDVDLAAQSGAARAAQSGAARRGPGESSAALLPALLTRCAARQPLPALPKFFASEAGELAIVMPWDPQYPDLPGEGEPFPGLARGGALVPRRIRRCRLRLQEASAPVSATAQVPWTVERADL